MLKYIALIFTFALLAGCQTMSKKECRTADWYETGYQDGKRGEPRSRFASIDEDCAKARIKADASNYFAGRDVGLKEFCTPSNAFEYGKQGGSNQEVCPAKYARDFDVNYRAGKRIYEQRQAIDNLESERKNLENKLKKASKDADKKDARDALLENDKQMQSARDRLSDLERRY